MMATHRPLSRDPESLGGPRLGSLSSLPAPSMWNQPNHAGLGVGAKEWEPSLGGALVASNHPEIMRAWRVLRAAAEATLLSHLIITGVARGGPGRTQTGGAGTRYRRHV